MPYIVPYDQVHVLITRQFGNKFGAHNTEPIMREINQQKGRRSTTMLMVNNFVVINLN